MRAIKFKGKRCDNGEWAYGDLVLSATSFPNILWVGDDSIVIDTPIIRQETIGQFTGLRDRVGTEIYEGDILEYCSGVDSFGAVWQTVRVEYRVDEGGYVGINQYCKTRDGRDIVQNIVRCLNKCIVCGNIYDEKGGGK